MKRTALSGLLAGAIALIAALPANAQVAEGSEVLLRQTYNTSRVVYVELEPGVLVSYEHDDSRLFPVTENLPVRITKLERGDELEVEFEHATLDDGKIEADLRGVPNRDEAIRRILLTAFLDPAEPDSYEPVVVNAETGVAHFRGSNHLPDPDHRLAYASVEEAREAGHESCSVCFYRTPRVANYLTERQLGAQCAAQARFYYPTVIEEAAQRRIAGLGERALDSWPVPLKGYPYTFELIRGDEANAFACPAGRIFITTGLLDVIEDDLELESILAHEIGHVEMRHGYRQLQSAQKANMWGAIAAAVAGVAVEEAGGDGATVAGITAGVAGLASELVLSGYSRRFEMESDSLASVYLQTEHAGGVGPSPMGQVLRKIRYSAAVRGLEIGDADAFSSHPHIDDRIDRGETSEVRATPGWVFEGLDDNDNLVARLEFVLQSVTRSGDARGLELLGSIETTPLLGDDDEVKDMRVYVGSEDWKLDNKEDTKVFPGDGAGLIFVTDDRVEFLESIDRIRLDLRNVRTWRRIAEPE